MNKQTFLNASRLFIMGLDNVKYTLIICIKQSIGEIYTWFSTEHNGGHLVELVECEKMRSW